MIFRTLAFVAVFALSAFAQESRMDWKWGRPGVMVDTNAAATVTINGVPWWTATNGAFVVVGGEGGASTVLLFNGAPWSTETNGEFVVTATGLGALTAAETTQAVATVTGPISSEMNASNAVFSAWFAELLGRTNYWDAAYGWGDWSVRVAALDSRTNAWDTAYGWGDHAEAGYLTAEADPVALAALTNRTVTVNGQIGSLNSNLTFTVDATNLVTALHDSQSASYFQTVENGTGTVWVVYDALALSEDFAGGELGSVWPTNIFPATYTIGGIEFVGSYSNGFARIDMTGLSESSVPWVSTNTTFPQMLIGISEEALGTAIVTKAVYTNAVRTYADNATVQAIEARLTEVEGRETDAGDVRAAVAPSTLTLYGANGITNETGFGAFLSTNNAALSTITNVNPVAGQTLASYQYRVTSDRVTGPATMSARMMTLGGAGGYAINAIAETFSAEGAVLSSNSVGRFNVVAATNLVASFAIPSVSSGGVVRVSFVEVANSARDALVFTGGSYPLTLTLTSVPISYATTSDLDAKLNVTGGTATDLTLAGTVTLTNGTSFFAGVYLGTNGVAFARDGTNYWILLP